MHNPLAGGIYDALFEIHTDGKTVDLGAVVDDAVCWIAELALQNIALQEKLERDTSAGYVRRDTSELTYLHPPIATESPAVETDDWIATGKEY
jgi:hypothetical protein